MEKAWLVLAVLLTPMQVGAQTSPPAQSTPAVTVNVVQPPASAPAPTLAPIWPMTSALTASIGLFATIILFMLSQRTTRNSNSARMVLDLSTRFHSQEMRVHRGRLARQLLDEQALTDLSKDWPPLLFFEEIGFMTRKGVLDEVMIWNSFFWYLERYYLSITQPKDLIHLAQDATGAPTLYKECTDLFRRLCEINTAEGGGHHYVPPPSEKITVFLRDEVTLAPQEAPVQQA